MREASAVNQQPAVCPDCSHDVEWHEDEGCVFPGCVCKNGDPDGYHAAMLAASRGMMGLAGA